MAPWWQPLDGSARPGALGPQEEQPPWMDHDVEIWERFRMAEEENLFRFSVRGVNNHFVQLWQHGQMLFLSLEDDFGYILDPRDLSFCGD